MRASAKPTKAAKAKPPRWRRPIGTEFIGANDASAHHGPKTAALKPNTMTVPGTPSNSAQLRDRDARLVSDGGQDSFMGTPRDMGSRSRAVVFVLIMPTHHREVAECALQDCPSPK